MQLHVSMLNPLEVKYNRAKLAVMNVISKTIRYNVFNLSRLYMNCLLIILCNIIRVIF